MFPISITAAILARVAAVAGVLALGYFLIDAIGDAREAQVHAAYDKAILKINDQVDTQLTIDEKMAAVEASLRAKALQNALALPSIAPVCPATSPQAERLNAIH